MFRKLLVVVGVIVAARALSQATGPGLVLVGVLAWALEAYLVWRAWPQVRTDLSGLRGRVSRRARETRF